MTKRMLVIVAVSILMAIAVTPLAAQTLTLTANIPFEFIMAGKTMPAGQYEVARSFSTPMIVLRGIEQRTGALSIVLREPVASKNPAADTRLVFNRYGDHYFLHEVVNAYASLAYTLPETHAEHEMAKVATVQPTEVLAVLARR